MDDLEFYDLCQRAIQTGLGEFDRFVNPPMHRRVNCPIRAMLDRLEQEIRIRKYETQIGVRNSTISR